MAQKRFMASLKQRSSSAAFRKSGQAATGKALRRFQRNRRRAMHPATGRLAFGYQLKAMRPLFVDGPPFGPDLRHNQ
jgi:hypothetical protein